MDRIAELHRGEMLFYGGNFSAYTEAVEAAQQVAESNVRNAEQQLKLQKRQMQQARERADRRAGNAARNLKNAGLPKIVAGKLKRDAQESAGRSDEVHAARVNDARARLDDAERALRDDAGDRAGSARHQGARRTHGVHRRGFADESRRPKALRSRVST